MAAHTKIEWTDHSWSPWLGCSPVHAGCANCYAEEMHAKRLKLVEWGPRGTRKIVKDWVSPYRWNRRAEQGGRVDTIFCSPSSDVFEDRDDLALPRRQLFELIDATPNLRWLVLTKRPQNIRDMWPSECSTPTSVKPVRRRWNVWLGTSVSDQATADAMIPELLKCRDLCAGLFVSAEPLLGPITLKFTDLAKYGEIERTGEAFRSIDWLIVGGESGRDARPMHPAWVRSLRDQATSAGVPFFFKQWGEWAPAGATGEHCWNPGASIHDLITSRRVGKGNAGATLDGREWRQTPWDQAIGD